MLVVNQLSVYHGYRGKPLQWRHNGRDSVSNHQPHDCFLNCLDADQRKHQSSASLAFVQGIHRGPVNSPHKWPVTRKMFPFDDVIMPNVHLHSESQDLHSDNYYQFDDNILLVNSNTKHLIVKTVFHGCKFNEFHLPFRCIRWLQIHNTEIITDLHFWPQLLCGKFLRDFIVMTISTKYKRPPLIVQRLYHWGFTCMLYLIATQWGCTCSYWQKARTSIH